MALAKAESWVVMAAERAVLREVVAWATSRARVYQGLFETLLLGLRSVSDQAVSSRLARAASRAERAV